MNPPEPWSDPWVVKHSQDLWLSYRQLTGEDLIDEVTTPLLLARHLFYAPFVLVSHGLGADPVLNYGNRQALELWEMDWVSFTRTPSRLTAAADQQPEREAFLSQAQSQGYVRDYRGLRVSRTGRRFWIKNALVWNVLGPQETRLGQAAKFAAWERVP